MQLNRLTLQALFIATLGCAMLQGMNNSSVETKANAADSKSRKEQMVSLTSVGFQLYGL
jgi:hypothetical protein